MKKILVALMLVISSMSMMAQSANVATEIEEEEIFMVVDKAPEYPGGMEAMMKFLSENTKYPVIAKEKGIEGRVICQFVVEKDGSISNVTVLRTSGDTSLDSEAVRVISTMPKWKPGILREKVVRVKYAIPISFYL